MDDAGRSAALAKTMAPIYRREAQACKFTVAGDTRPIAIMEEPVFESSNLAARGAQGVVFLWLRNGKPAADVKK